MSPGRKLVFLTTGVCLFLVALVAATAALLLVGGAVEGGSDTSAAEGRVFGVVALTLVSLSLIHI